MVCRKSVLFLVWYVYGKETMCAAMARLEDTSRKIDLYLIRHAESKNNELYDKFSDGPEFQNLEAKHRDRDCPLSQLGEKQAECLTQYVSSADGEWRDILTSDYRIYTSPMRRCLDTARAIRTSSAVHNDIRVVHNLYETGGCFDTLENGDTVGVAGATEVEVMTNYPGFLCEDGMANGWYHRDKKETMAEFDARTNEVVDWIWGHVSTHDLTLPPRSIVLVIHGNLISSILNGLLFGNGVTRAGLFVHCNTGMSHLQLVEVEETGKRIASVQYINHTPHLSLSPSPSPSPLSSRDKETTDSSSEAGRPGTTTDRESLRRGNALFKDRWIHEFL